MCFLLKYLLPCNIIIDLLLATLRQGQFLIYTESPALHPLNVSATELALINQVWIGAINSNHCLSSASVRLCLASDHTISVSFVVSLLSFCSMLN